MEDLLELVDAVGEPPVRPGMRERRRSAKRNRLRTLVCVLENPKTVANIAGVIRSVNALGVSKLYVIDPMRVYARESVNSLSVGSARWTFVRVFDSTSSCIRLLRERGYTSVGTSPHCIDKRNVDLGSGRFTDRKLAVWFGNESHGLSSEAIDSCDRCVQIPMRGMVESYNLASSAAIVLYTVANQRTNYRCSPGGR